MTTLDSVNDITVREYVKGCGGTFNCKLPDINVLSMDGDNLTCTMGGVVEQTIAKTSALAYINSCGGFI